MALPPSYTADGSSVVMRVIIARRAQILVAFYDYFVAVLLKTTAFVQHSPKVPMVSPPVVLPQLLQET